MKKLQVTVSKIDGTVRTVQRLSFNEGRSFRFTSNKAEALENAITAYRPSNGRLPLFRGCCIFTQLNGKEVRLYAYTSDREYPKEIFFCDKTICFMNISHIEHEANHYESEDVTEK